MSSTKPTIPYPGDAIRTIEASALRSQLASSDKNIKIPAIAELARRMLPPITEKYAELQSDLRAIHASLPASEKTGESTSQMAFDLLRNINNNYTYPRAKFSLGYCYETGTGVTKEPKRAVALYQEAADMGEARAKNNLGGCYETGAGVTKEPKRAVALYQEAADMGEASAKANLGRCYARGIGVTKEPERAVALYQEAVDMGEARAKVDLGYCYETGTGVTKDPVKATKYYIEAKLIGGVMRNGFGMELDSIKQMLGEVEKLARERGNPDLAKGWLVEMAKTMPPEGKELLAQYFNEGKGIKKDPATAERLKGMASVGATVSAAGVSSEAGAAGAGATSWLSRESARGDGYAALDSSVSKAGAAGAGAASWLSREGARGDGYAALGDGR